MLLAATERMAFGTAWPTSGRGRRRPRTAPRRYLAQAYPGRFTLGLGVGYPQQAVSVGREFGSPLATMRDYVDRMDAQTLPPAPDTAYPRILGANGPKMLALAGEITDGALPAGLPPEYTARARQLLGPDKLLVVGQSVVVDDDRDRARAARGGGVDLGRPGLLSYDPGRARLPGRGDRRAERRVVDALVAHGGPDAIAAKVRAHLAAGADHVTLLLPIGTEFTPGIDALAQVAPALTDLR